MLAFRVHVEPRNVVPNLVVDLAEGDVRDDVRIVAARTDELVELPVGSFDHGVGRWWWVVWPRDVGPGLPIDSNLL